MIKPVFLTKQFFGFSSFMFVFYVTFKALTEQDCFFGLTIPDNSFLNFYVWDQLHLDKNSNSR